MDSQKFENILNLALDTEEEVRERSLELNIGYEKEDNTWELIVKYHGSLQQGLSPFFDLPQGRGLQIEELIAGYAILTVPESFIEALPAVEEIEYIEKPKRLFFEILQGKIASCIVPGSSLALSLRGEGVLVAVIDSGIAWRNRDFCNADGTSRIRFLWDQTLQAERVWERIEENDLLSPERETEYAPPEGFLTGVEFTQAQINEALNTASEVEGNLLVPSVDTSGHGTAVAGIAAGNGLTSGGTNAGVAPLSELIIVKLGTPRAESFPRTTELMRALTYVVRKSLELQKPVAVNLSFGNTYGAHNGTSLLERFIDNVSEIGRNVICVGSGNEGASGGHTAGSVGRVGSRAGGTQTGSAGGLSGGVNTSGESTSSSVELIVGSYESGLNVQLWKDYVDRYRVRVISPMGEEFTVDTGRPGKQTYLLEQTRILLYNGEPAPYLTSQEIYFDFLPVVGGSYLNNGVWTFVLEAIETVTGNYTFYLPSETVRSEQTRFVRPTPQVTLTIPSTAAKVITVGAYQTGLEAYADFSGRGYLYQDRLGSRTEGSFIKPDLAAPGVGILAPTREGTYAAVSGTSFATPFVTGAAALLMQWGIVNGNDPYLYGEKVKAYLRKGATPIRGEREYPNERVGFGALCVEGSLPG
ncbi:MAG: S8 family serine peptidase [Ruminococcus flavefaciens]|nr:S8 family serine peptidase [Roseburia sp.]MCM1231424.1 S8 family serine peptidase [Ruminococcus flavefaciens]